MRERRKHTRLDLQHEAELIFADNISVRGKTKDISFSGIFFRCTNAPAIPVGTTCFIHLYLGAVDKTGSIKFECEIVRTTDTGVGIKFICVDLAGYNQFKNLMVYNSPEPDTLMEELEKNPGLEIV